MDFTTLMQFLMPRAEATPMASGVRPVSPAETIGQQLDVAKAAIPPRPRAGPYRYTPGGQWGAAHVQAAGALQRQYENALGNPGAVQNDPRSVPELQPAAGLGARF